MPIHRSMRFHRQSTILIMHAPGIHIVVPHETLRTAMSNT
jgi:hypothetical protein